MFQSNFFLLFVILLFDTISQKNGSLDKSVEVFVSISPNALGECSIHIKSINLNKVTIESIQK